MSWAKLDDRYDDHRKLKRAWRLHRGTVGLHAMAITYCSRHELDGVVDIEWIADKLPAPKEREKVLAALVECRLFEPVDAEHYRVHGFLDYNPSREQLKARRRADAERKAKARGPKSERTPSGVQPESSCPIPSHPIPAPVPPNPQGGIADPAPLKPKGKRQTDIAEYEEGMNAWCARHFPGADRRAVESTIVWTRLDGPVTADALRAAAQTHPIWAAQLGLGNEGEAAA